MAGNIVANQIRLGDSATDSNNFNLRTNVTTGTATLARGAAGSLGDLITIPSSGAAKIVGAQQLAQIQTFQTGAVATGAGTVTLSDAVPQITDGNEYMTLAFTPTNISSTLEIDVSVFGSHSTTNSTIILMLFRDAVSNALAATSCLEPSGTGLLHLNLKHVMTAGTTSAMTFRVRVASNGATFTFNGISGGRTFGGIGASRITIKEYLP